MAIEPKKDAVQHGLKNILDTLENVDKQTLGEWWCWLNSCSETCHWHQCIQVMNEIEKIIGHKACNREWNKDRMTDKEHAEWYANNFNIK